MSTRIGDCYYDPETERCATVIEVSDGDGPRVAVLQFDDGTPGTIDETDVEALLRLPLSAVAVESLPALQDACVEGGHCFGHADRDAVLGRTDVDYYPRCDRCRLSSRVLVQYLGHSITASVGDVCDDCEADIGCEAEIHKDVEGRPICDDCWERYDPEWRMPANLLATEFAFYDPVCGWFSDDRPSGGRVCPACGAERVTIISRDSGTYESLCGLHGDADC